MRSGGVKRTCGATALLTLLGSVTAAAPTVSIQGAGATFPAPLYGAWAAEYGPKSGVRVTYDAVGSGLGLERIRNRRADFGASDAPLSASTTPCNGCFQIPWALSATGVSFNVPGVHSLHLTGGVIARIYLGQITN
ncbi:MAG TPA: substrate-binding domain-containing protein, partial [Steroidobacteraceae bacterium]|nr:substrate-binding domain-containing protein [Steroidobacteraceae bacterium]